MTRTLLTAIALGMSTPVFAVLSVTTGLIHPTRRSWAFAARWWARSLLVPAGVRLEVSGREHVTDGAPRVFVGNHQSALDIPILMQALGGDIRFMAKKSLFRIPLFGWALSANRFIPIDRSSARTVTRRLDRALEELRRDPVSIALFPEGTRSPDGRLLPFRRGAMKICRRSEMGVVPFTIDGAVNVLCRTGYRVTPGTVRLVFARPIPAEEVAAMTPAQLHDRIRSTIARELDSSSHRSVSVSVGAESAPGAARRETEITVP